MIRFLENLLRPPNSLIWLAMIGLVLLRTRRRRAGAAVLAVSVVCLYLLSTPVVVEALMSSLDRHPPIDPSGIGRPDAQAIVVLSAGKTLALELGEEVVTAAALERLRYAAWLQREVERPILLTGVTSSLMDRSLSRWFGTEARWVETESRNTHEHAERCAELLRAAGIERIYLVTHYWHMPRAVAAFRQIDGLEIVPAPLGFGGGDPWPWYHPKWVLPGTVQLYASALALHEWIGRAWYRVRYGY